MFLFIFVYFLYFCDGKESCDFFVDFWDVLQVCFIYLFVFGKVYIQFIQRKMNQRDKSIRVLFKFYRKNEVKIRGSEINIGMQMIGI